MSETLKIFGILLVIFIVIGSALQTKKAFPKLLNKEFDIFASKVTILLILIVISFGLFMYFLQIHAREGFETEEKLSQFPFKEWNALVTKLHVKEVCDLYTYVFDAMKQYNKGATAGEQKIEKPSDYDATTSPADPMPGGADPALSDDDADWITLVQIALAIAGDNPKNRSSPPTYRIVACKKFQELQNAPDLDTFFIKIQELPDNFFTQAYDTTKVCRKYLRDQLIDVQENLKIKDPKTGKEITKDKADVLYPLEPFANPSVGICDPETAEERRKFLREQKLTEKQQQCLLPEEVSLESKKDIINNKFQKIQSYVTQEMIDNLPIILKQATMYREKLETYKKEAEAGILRPEGETAKEYSDGE